jgi:hypothetical protein
MPALVLTDKDKHSPCRQLLSSEGLLVAAGFGEDDFNVNWDH